MITLTQPKVPEAKIRGSQKAFQWVILGLGRVPGVIKGARRGPMGPWVISPAGCGVRGAERRGRGSRGSGRRYAGGEQGTAGSAMRLEILVTGLPYRELGWKKPIFCGREARNTPNAS